MRRFSVALESGSRGGVRWRGLHANLLLHALSATAGAPASGALTLALTLTLILSLTLITLSTNSNAP